MKKFTTVFKTFVFAFILLFSYSSNATAQIDVCGSIIDFQILKNGQLTWSSDNVKPVRYSIVYFSTHPTQGTSPIQTLPTASNFSIIKDYHPSLDYWFIIQAYCGGDTNYWLGHISNAKVIELTEINLDKIEMCCNETENSCNCSPGGCGVCELIDAIKGAKKTGDLSSTLNIKTFPNPTSNESNIQYTLTENTRVSLTVYDVSGRKVVQLIDNEQQTSNDYLRTFDVSKLTSGVYYYLLETETTQQMLKVLKY